MRVPDSSSQCTPATYQKRDDVHLRNVGESALLVELPADAVQSLSTWLMHGKWRRWIEDIVPSHRTVLVMAQHHLTDIAAAIRTQEWRTQTTIPPSSKVLRVPVMYGGEDFDEVCEQTGLTGEEFISLHSGTEHAVSHFGFSPGFPYLSGVPQRLHVPRRATPRQSIPKGSVAIAAGLTVIYPGGTPGGWNIIGRAEAPPFWDITMDPPNLLALGDRIIFEAHHD